MSVGMAVLFHVVILIKPFVSLTDRRSHRHDNGVSRVLDEVDNFPVVQVVDVHVVDGQDPVSHVQLPAALGRRALDDAADGGASSGHGGDDHEAEAFTLPPRHSHVVRVSLGQPRPGAAVGVCNKKRRNKIISCLVFLIH